MKRYSFNTLLFIALASAIFYGTTAFAATTDIANAPLASTSSTVVKPNILFVLGDSRTMSWPFLPEAAYNFNGGYGYLSSQCNAAYYNPNITYQPPLDSTGASYADASFTDARTNGFDPTSARVDLSSQFVANTFVPAQPDDESSWCWGTPLVCYNNKVGPFPAHYYTYSGTQTTKDYNNTKSTFYKECKSAIDASPGKSVFTKVTVSATSGPNGADERTNFANWYSYYRVRMLAMKTSASRAFSSLTDSYRVGYLSINNNTGKDFLNIGDFNSAQKAAWYAKLFAAKPQNATPLRSALSTAGRIYAGKMNGKSLNGSTVTDPIQYSCQQNFAILSTDGLWKGDENVTIPQIDGTTAIGNQDGTAATPMKDALNKSNTLADVAMYYYQTDLRNPALGNCTGALGAGTDVCENNVLGSGADINTQQHMTTFTLGLGISGTLGYAEDYLSGGSADYNAIIQGTKNWPDPITYRDISRVDDLWHAAVNGRGTYFSAQNPDSLVNGLSKALAGVKASTGSSAAAATSNLEPVAGDNYVYIALYRTVKWDGDLQAKTIDPSTGAISATPVWSAQPLLDAKVSSASDTRTIYTFDSTAANKLKIFTWSKLSDTEKAYFNNMCPSSGTVKLSQCTTLTDDQKEKASGENLVNFIHGQDGYEDQTSNSDAKRIYRDREHVLGDMISSQPVYVKAPPFSYVDAGYSDFKDAQNKRAAMVYVAVNDGMIHAFNGDTGQEQWAYIPPAVMPNLHKLADKNYSANHQYYVDGSPTIGDICPNAPGSTCSKTDWKTILVGGLNAGGRGYYALDITSPTGPKALWNFTDTDLGYTFGNPVITKRKDGTWVVVFTSGYNNVSPGNGKGYLYVVNANTGALLEKISTGTGSEDTPSGLGKINAWIDNTTDNTAKRFYGGDLLGNVWRFDIDDIIPPAGKEAFLLATVGQVNGAGMQSITTKPELTEITAGSISYAVVNVGTGRYLGAGDLGDTSQQSVYSFKDDLTTTGLGLVRTAGVLVRQTLTSSTGASGEQLRTSSTNAVDWATQSGWYVDLNPNNESPGERVNVDMQMQLGLLTVAGNVPNTNACNLGGYAWLYYFDYKTGQYVPTSTNNAVGKRLSTNALVAGLKTIKLTTGKTLTIVTDTGGGITGNDDPTSGASGAGAKRVSWRELIN